MKKKTSNRKVVVSGKVREETKKFLEFRAALEKTNVSRIVEKILMKEVQTWKAG